MSDDNKLVISWAAPVHDLLVLPLPMYTITFYQLKLFTTPSFSVSGSKWMNFLVTNTNFFSNVIPMNNNNYITNNMNRTTVNRDRMARKWGYTTSNHGWRSHLKRNDKRWPWRLLRAQGPITHDLVFFDSIVRNSKVINSSKSFQVSCIALCCQILSAHPIFNKLDTGTCKAPFYPVFQWLT
jgi:hypothetical protein